VSLHYEVPDNALRAPPPGQSHDGPARIYHPADSAGVAEVVRDAAEAVVWLDSPCAPPLRQHERDPMGRECWRISFEHMTRVLEVDRPRRRVRVQGGLKVADLVTALAHHGLSLPMVAPAMGLSVAAAVSRTGFADHVEALGIVVASGSVVEITREIDAPLFEMALQGFGAVGLVAEVTLRVVDSPSWRVHRERLPLEVAAARFTAAAERDPAAQRHALVWWPHCAWAVSEQTDFQPERPAPLREAPPARSRAWHERLTSALVLLSARWPELLRWLQPFAAHLSPPTGTSTEAAATLQANRERPAQWRLDAAVPRDRITAMLEALAPLLRAPGAHVTRPVRVRALPPGVGLMSPARARPMALLSVCSTSDEVAPMLRDRLVATLVAHGARPLGAQTTWSEAQALEATARAATLLEVSKRVDPTGLFRGPAFLRMFSP